LTIWIELDLGSHETFFRSTPRLLSLLVEGKRRAADADHHNRAWLAWTTAALGRAKKMPPLKDLVGTKAKAKKPTVMSADQMLTMARMWSAVAGPPTEKDSHE
jgi:hypothetical protein